MSQCLNVCQGYKDPPVQEMLSSPVATAGALAGALFLAAQGLSGDMLALAGAHAEPANALSFPTYTSLEKSRDPLAPCMCALQKKRQLACGGLQVDGAHEFSDP